MIRKFILLTAALFLSLVHTQAQEFNAVVTVRYDRIQGVDGKVFESMQRSLIDLLNNRKWTDDVYKQNEKIDATFLLNLSKRNGNLFSGTLSIQVTRPVFNATYATPIVNYIDKDISFKYEQNQVIQFDEQRISGVDPAASNLSAIFAYYAYYILGLEYDSFQQGSGTQYFKKAQTIVLNAPEDGKSIGGWKANEGNNKNRYWLVDQILNPRFEDFRPYFYTYHRFGLDQMANNSEEGRQAILEGLDNLVTINKQNPQSILIQFFFNAKSGEFLNILKTAPAAERAALAAKLASLDVPNASKYNDAK